MRILLSIMVLLHIFSYEGIAQVSYNLFEDSVPNSIKDEPSEANMPTITAYYPAIRYERMPAVIVIPGGAYSFLAYEEEGSNIAKEFAARNVVAFVLKYRMPDRKSMRDKRIGPVIDGQQAIKLIRENSKRFMIDPHRLGVIGFSAGGHLASTIGTHFTKNYIPNKFGTNLRPDFMILVYPVISMEDSITHSGSKIALLGMDPVETDVIDLSNEFQVSKDTPPTYLTHSEDDRIVDVRNSIVFYEALQKHKVYSELHLIQEGDHGFIQRVPTNEWLDPIFQFLYKEEILVK